jgi:hypothetical protein
MSGQRQILFTPRQVLAAARLNAALDEVGTYAAAPGAVTRTVQDKLRETVSVLDFGAVSDGVTNDTAAIQAAIDYMAGRGGGVVTLPNGDYRIAKAGMFLSGTRGYCIKLKSGVSLEGLAPGGSRLVYTRTNEVVDLLVTDPVGDIDAGLTTKNIALRNVTIDGDSDAAATGDGMSLWISHVRNLTIENFRSEDSTNWGVRLQECDGVSIVNLVTRHGPDLNADGLHFVDCRNVACQCRVYTQGDDGVIIESLAHDVWGYDLDVIVETPVTVVAAGRGILLLHEPLESAAARIMRDISIRGVVFNCLGSAFVTDGALHLSNVTVDITARDCANGVYLVAGSASVAGSITDCYFDAVITDCADTGITVISQSGSVIRNNRLDALISNPGNGAVAATLRGSFWTGEIQIDYNPNADKTTFGFGLDMFASDSSINISSRGAGRNVYVRAGADRNVFRPGRLFESTVADIEIVSGHTSPPVFIGGMISGSVINPNLATFVGVVGAPLTTLDQLAVGGAATFGGAVSMIGPLTGTAVTQTDTDSTAGRVLKVGDFGLGAFATAPLLASFDASTLPGGAVYRYNATTTGTAPSGAATTGWVETLRIDGGTLGQRLTENATAMRMWRRVFSGSWGAWQGPV